jgi:hypothetical protein
MTTSAIQSWSEPSSGSRLDWGADRWRYAKLCLIPVTIFSIAAFSHLGLSITAIAWLAGISGLLMVYLWLLTFVPRVISIFEDRVAITKCGRDLTATSIFYSNIRDVKTAPCRKHYRVTLLLKTGRCVMLVAPCMADAERIRDAFERHARGA